MYSTLITDIDALQARARPLVDRYLEHIREDKAMEVRGWEKIPCCCACN